MSSTETDVYRDVPDDPRTCGRELVVLEAIHAKISARSEVLRLLPHKERRMVGAWCFVDLYGPRPIDGADAMHVAPHPHTGLQTVSWLASGTVRHRDSLGSVADIMPGRAAVMTAGAGIAHSEDVVVPSGADGGGGRFDQSASAATVLHGAQLWVALPEAGRHGPREFVLHEPAPSVVTQTVRVAVFFGELAGAVGPAQAQTPLVGAELTPVGPSGGSAVVPVEAAYEHVLVPMGGTVTVAGVTVGEGQALFLGTDRDEVEVALSADARILLLGGAPFEEEIVMWWNFVARTHEEIEEARARWNAGGDDRFGEVDYPEGERLTAPPLPNVRLKPRGRVR
ncbi:MAG: pirin family protein [Lapillicoccus sp.]